MFIDTSAVIAILAREPDAGDFAEKIAQASRPISAGHVLLEASIRLASMLRVEPGVAKDAVLERFKEAGVAIVLIDIVVAESAVAAFARFGRDEEGKLSSISAIACPTPAPRSTKLRCCSRAVISRRRTRGGREMRGAISRLQMAASPKVTGASLSRAC